MLLLSLAACTSQPTGSVQFLASIHQALSANDVTRVTVTVSASDMPSRVVELAKSNAAWGGSIGSLPAGSNRSFLAEAFDSVLLTGGRSAGTTAQVYDPDINSWSPAASMAWPRAAHTATLLSSGKVLVSGGYNGATLFSSAELYTP